MDDSDREFRRSEGQLRVPARLSVICARNQALRAFHHGGDERVRGGIFGGVEEGFSNARKRTDGPAHCFGLLRPSCRLEDKGHQQRQRSLG